MLYVLKKTGQSWLVDQINFTSPPQVGRTRPTWIADRESLHAVAGNNQDKESKQP
jgi:hypothetical protein